jgi:hypothetical protein
VREIHARGKRGAAPLIAACCRFLPIAFQLKAARKAAAKDYSL